MPQVSSGTCVEPAGAAQVTAPPLPGSELDALLCFDLYAASRAVTAAYRPILEGLGLTYPQYLVLTVLWARHNCSIRYLAERLRLDHATLTPLLRRMEGAGLLRRERSTTDERSVIVFLAAGGEDLRQQASGIQCRIAEAMGIDDDELSGLQAVLRRIETSTRLSR